MLVPLSCDLQTNIPHKLSLLSVTDIRLPFKSTSMRTLDCLSLWVVFHLKPHMTIMNVTQWGSDCSHNIQSIHSYYISDRKSESFKEVEAVGEKGLKWCDICLALFGTILSFGDPTTDILTLAKFYRADHKKWFTVGLVFIILLCSLYFLACPRLSDSIVRTY